METLVNQSILDVVKGMYPDFSEDKAKALVFRTLPWVTLLGTTTVEKLDTAKAKGLEDIEARAQIVAFNVVSSMLFQRYANTEQEQLETLTAKILEMNVGESTPV